MIKVLIVDDEEAIADFIGECIEMIDDQISTEVTYSGVTASSLLDQSQYDLVFSDLMMPEVGGKEILAKANQMPGTPPVFCLVTGHSKSIGKALSYRGPLLLLPKPFKFNDIEMIINQFCKK